MNELIQIGAVSPLRQRLIDDMTMRRFSRDAQRNYLRDVGRFATWLGCSPHTATAEDIRQFQIEQQQAGVPVPTMNNIVGAFGSRRTRTTANGRLRSVGFWITSGKRERCRLCSMTAGHCGSPVLRSRMFCLKYQRPSPTRARYDARAVLAPLFTTITLVDDIICLERVDARCIFLPGLVSGNVEPFPDSENSGHPRAAMAILIALYYDLVV